MDFSKDLVVKLSSAKLSPSFLPKSGHNRSPQLRTTEEPIASASRNDLAELARILAQQAAQCARKYGELQLPDLAGLHTASSLEEQNLGLLRDGTVALVGVLGIVTGSAIDEDEGMMQ